MEASVSGVTHTLVTDGLLVHLRQLGVSLLEHAAMRAELLSVEVQEEKARLARLALGTALAGVLLTVSLVLASMLVLAAYWDTPNRMLSVFCLAGVFGVMALGSVLYVVVQLQQPSALFATSAHELRRDAALLQAAQLPPIK